MPKLEEIRMPARSDNEPFTIIFDFDNDRHHAELFDVGGSPKTIARKLKEMADRLMFDPHLAE